MKGTEEHPMERGTTRTSVLVWPLIALVIVYRVTLGPFLGGRCRFHPSCSAYALESLRVHGAVRGSWLSMRRLLRCHPFGGHGFDPVPLKKPTRTKIGA
jgi:putative membrane protein insertion efficiency factor